MIRSVVLIAVAVLVIPAPAKAQTAADSAGIRQAALDHRSGSPRNGDSDRQPETPRA